MGQNFKLNSIILDNNWFELFLFTDIHTFFIFYIPQRKSFPNSLKHTNLFKAKKKKKKKNNNIYTELNALCCTYTINIRSSYLWVQKFEVYLASCSCCGWLYFLPLLLSFLFSITKIIHILSRSSIQFHYPVIYEGWYFTHMRKTLAWPQHFIKRIGPIKIVSLRQFWLNYRHLSVNVHVYAC